MQECKGQAICKLLSQLHALSSLCRRFERMVSVTLQMLFVGIKTHHFVGIKTHHFNPKVPGGHYGASCFLMCVYYPFWLLPAVGEARANYKF